MGKINASDKIMSKNHKKEKIWNAASDDLTKKFLHKALSKRSHSFLRRADARGCTDIIYRVWCISL